VCVLGMHRTGTSLAAAVVAALGVSFGARETMVRAPADDAPSGYWEQEEILQINDELLSAFGGNWWSPPTFPPGWWRDARLDPVRRRARDVIAGLSRASRWGFKDPRTSLTLPFWTDLVGDVSSVVCLRDPDEVARSLRHRYRHSSLKIRPLHPVRATDWKELWYRYTSDALQNSAASPRLILSYADWFGPGDVARERQAERLASFLGLPTGNEARAQIARLIEPDLWRQRPRFARLRLSRPSPAARLYRSLHHERLVTAEASAPACRTRT
jgi:hypothetical protein